ncbi:MAG: hypothetical protein A2600_00835 [Candidatus Lambdaproteobacteria bacterium RIFOXYD1_FULL_56_27]|uniref:SHSP domain-containing protein n=1 Tax=Candidatus Lambdaproteobacteria bacterium RIFOXYD2_FULL_56_26 TaxID=1817773 RepID=A0A1F6GLU0_9PROT|nr:MAG: hypothetical protein A2557_09685 [Candidatus Lambdaproteobacteria bacterium RIFOXYD2_FULL_56_26]OGH05728.1 MAG: hypothetical protein A2426_04045 [Candidatus Lambdaproteobacteria bacterium RIFOXYC1_FULL_56_13]OGH07113.1 MAG: hypothetical protein A2600_00835 [Candidatus Lambdaproteobacteria bacterium RIFOXYD1_FULL_56_27]
MRAESLRYYQPLADILETDQALLVTLDMAGVTKDRVEVSLEKNQLTIEGRIDTQRYESLKAVYAEYNIGHYRRTFLLSQEIDREGIQATLNDGVLQLTLPKRAEEQARKVTVH